jgi:hypothetical protein
VVTDRAPVRSHEIIGDAGPSRRRHQVHQAPAAGADDIDIVDVWGQDSFPASDPPANW